jgi:hypothetical protein
VIPTALYLTPTVSVTFLCAMAGEKLKVKVNMYTVKQLDWNRK